MDGIFFLVFVSILLIMIVLGLLLSFTIVFQTEFFMKNVFPKEKPKMNLFFSKEKGAGDQFILYFGARFFVACIAILFAIWIYGVFTSN